MSRSPWRLLPYSEAAAGEELAHSEGLLAGLLATGRPAMRWYGARRMDLVIGSGQRLSEVDGVALAQSEARLYRRASGGSAVLFVPGFLMQDLALPPGHPLYRNDVSESYAWLGAVWVEALGELGLTELDLVSIAVARADARSADPLVRRACFGGRSPYEVLAGGRKLVGFSQLRRRAGALLQAGMYLNWPGRELAALLRLNATERADTVAALEQRVVGLNALLPTLLVPTMIMDAFAHALARRYAAELEPAPWRPDELAAAQATAGRYQAIDPDATMSPDPAS